MEHNAKTHTDESCLILAIMYCVYELIPGD